MKMKQKNKKEEFEVTSLGSLGLLALGHKGTKIWRNKIEEDISKRKKKNGK